MPDGGQRPPERPADSVPPGRWIFSAADPPGDCQAVSKNEDDQQDEQDYAEKIHHGGKASRRQAEEQENAGQQVACQGHHNQPPDPHKRGTGSLGAERHQTQAGDPRRKNHACRDYQDSAGNVCGERLKHHLAGNAAGPENKENGQPRKGKCRYGAKPQEGTADRQGQAGRHAPMRPFFQAPAGAGEQPCRRKFNQPGDTEYQDHWPCLSGHLANPGRVREPVSYPVIHRLLVGEKAADVSQAL